MSSRLRAPTTALVGFAACLVIAACSNDGSDAESVPFPELTPFPPALESQVHDIRDRTAALRGLPVNTEIEEGILPRTELADYLSRASEAQTEDERSRLETMEDAMRLLRMIGPDDDLEAMLQSFNSEEISGLYELEQNQLAVIGDVSEMDVAGELTLSHEYVHSFQDGAFGAQIEAMNELAKDQQSEYATTAPCVLEGDATLASVQYMTQTKGPLWIASLVGELGGAGLPENIPPALTRYLAFNYNECLLFVQNVYNQGGWDAVDALYDRPPATTEQVIHPAKYRSDERPTELARSDLAKDLGSGWKRSLLTPFGELDLQIYLQALGASRGQSTAGADGWGAGWLGTYARGDDRLVHVSLQFDDDVELTQFRTRYADALSKVDGLSRTESDGGATWSWQDPVVQGRAVWHPDDNRVDIVLGYDRAALDKAASALR